MIEFSMFLAAVTALAAAELFRRSRTARVARNAAELADDHAKTGADCETSEEVCQQLATRLEANAIVIERMRGEILVVAGAPWKTDVQPLDKIALDWSFATGLPPKSGGGNPFCSDWLFLPVTIGGRVAAILGVMARHGRRRFILDEQPAIRSAVSALQRIYRISPPRIAAYGRHDLKPLGVKAG